MPLEYIYSRKGLKSAGVVVASEFSTCSSLLSGSLKINPFNALSVADALDKALNMTAKECNQRRTRDISFVSTHPSSLWTRQILSDLQHLKGENGSSGKKSDKTVFSYHTSVQEIVHSKCLVDCYKTASNTGLSTLGTRILIFDYGGTLLFKEKFDVYIKQTLSAISGRKPTPKMMHALKVLSDDPNNIVMVMTGLTRLKVGDTFKGMKNITLVTSNGLVYSWGENLSSLCERRKESTTRGCSTSALDSALFPDDLFSQIDDEGREWSNFDFGIDWEAVCKIAVPIISQYTFRTNGTCLSPRWVYVIHFYFLYY